MSSSQQQNQPRVIPEPNGGLDPDYEFIFNDKQKKKHVGLHLPGGSNFTKVVLLVVGGGVALMVIIIVLSSVLVSGGVNTKQLVDVMARAQEISRVSDLIAQQQNNVDANTLNLAATASNSLTSEQVQLETYLHNAHIAVSTNDLNRYLNKNTDTQLQTAAQTNSLDSTFDSYLKTQLTSYESSIKTAYQNAPPKAQLILQNADTSVKTILSTSQLASSASQ